MAPAMELDLGCGFGPTGTEHTGHEANGPLGMSTYLEEVGLACL